MITFKLLLASLLLLYTLVNLCGCEFNIYLPVEKPVPEHIHNKYRMCQDGENGHHWECTICNLPTDIEAHSYNDFDYCTVCGYKKGGVPDMPGGGGFHAEIVIKEPSGYIEYSYKGNGLWTFSIKDKSNPKYSINKWTWYLFDEQVSTDSVYELYTPFSVSYQIYCKFENENGYADSTVVITGRTE